MAEPNTIGRDYSHPLTPYNIQVEFMDAVYNCIEDGKVGIFESPTGTGKSLSLLCGSLTWLRNHKRDQFEEKLKEDCVDEDEPDWVIEYAQNERRKAAMQRRKDFNARLKKIRAKEDAARKRAEGDEPPFKRLKTTPSKRKEEDGEARFLLDDFEDQAEAGASEKKILDSGLSATTQALIDKLDGSLQPGDQEERLPWENETKIFFCSRTHSQLSQLVSELQRIKMPPSLLPDPNLDKDCKLDPEDLVESFKHLALGSRKHLCINSEVRNQSNTIAINEKCQDLLEHKGCAYFPETKEKDYLFNQFRDHALAKVRDIEDLGRVGKELSVCPYYASRIAIDPSEVVSLPYPLLLQKNARDALSLKLKDHIVIVDEAHNLMETISDLHSVSISLAQLKRARKQSSFYLGRFQHRLKGRNRVFLAQLLKLIDSLRTCLEYRKQNAKDTTGIVPSGDILHGNNADQIDIYELLRYLRDSKLAYKLDGYEKYMEVKQLPVLTPPESTQQRRQRSTTPCLSFVETFMLALTYPSDEGRFFYEMPEPQSSDDDRIVLRYMLLDPKQHFQEIVRQARAVILAGGTMSPMEDYFQHLFPYLSKDKIMTLSCGHVIPRSHLLAMSIGKGPSNTDLQFTFERRQSQGMLQDLGMAILKTAEAVPDGLVVFFPSYAYLDTAIDFWQEPAQDGGFRSTWDKLCAAKPIFLESSLGRGTGSQPSSTLQVYSQSPSPSKSPSKRNPVEEVLAGYTARINDPTNERGALLFAVIGGSLSEGINFADKLGRGVIVVGLPFPNRYSPEWKAKLEFIGKRANTKAEREGLASEFITNACMRAVNQSIGRAIRHKDDYAAIMLFDTRYYREGIRGKLPGWIRSSLVAGREDFGASMSRLKRFFAEKARPQR